MGAILIMDRGIASQANLDWLVENNYRYLVVSRERSRQFTPEQAVQVPSASRQSIRIQRVISEDGSEVRLYCHSEKRQEKEDAMNARFIKRFEDGLQKIADSLSKPRGTKKTGHSFEADWPTPGEKLRHWPTLPYRFGPR